MKMSIICAVILVLFSVSETNADTEKLKDHFGDLYATFGDNSTTKVSIVSGPEPILMNRDKTPGKQWIAESGVYQFKLSIQDAVTGVTIGDLVNRIEELPEPYIRACKEVSDGNEQGISLFVDIGGARAHGGKSYINMRADAGSLVIAHEAGHVLEQVATLAASQVGTEGDLTILGQWKDAIAADNVSVSPYGDTVHSEDLAEFAQVYAVCLGAGSEYLAELDKLSPTRFDLWETMLVPEPVPLTLLTPNGSEQINAGIDYDIRREAEAKAVVARPPADLGVDAFFTKHLDCDGIAVIASDKVDDAAFYRLRDLLDGILKNRPDLRATLVSENFNYIIIAQDEQVTDIPNYANMKPKAFWNQRARGFGGRTTSCGEENLLCLPQDRYQDESIFIHELAHGIHSPGLRKCDPTFQAKINALYKQAMDNGLYKNDYASTNCSEYWAESVQAFFDCDRQNNWNHNDINTREELERYDPDMANLVREVFKITDKSDWRYKPFATQPSVQQTPKELSENGLLPKYVLCLGFSTCGTKNAPDQAMLSAANLTRNMFRYRYDILKDMIDDNVTIAVYNGGDVSRSFLDSNRLDADSFIKAEGSKAVANLPSQLRITTSSQSLLAGDDGKAAMPVTIIHDLALAAYFYTGLRPFDASIPNPKHIQQYEKELTRIDVRFDKKMQTLYQSAMKKGLWKSTPAAANRFEYFAHGTAAFFDAANITPAGHKTITNRKQLTAYDPDLAKAVADVFKHTERVDWRYKTFAK